MNVQAMQVGPHQLNQLEMLQLEAALRKEESLGQVFYSAAQGHTSLFRIWGACQGICAIQIHADPHDRHLFVWLLGGRRIALCLEALWEMLEQVAIAHGCKRVVARPTEQLAEIYKARLGFVDTPCGVSKEVDNGRRRLQNN